MWVKSLAGIFLGCVLYAGGIWKGDIMVADIEEVEEMDASERIRTPRQRLNAKELSRRWKVTILYSRSQKEQLKSLEEINVWEHPPQSGIVQNEERNKKFFEENQMNSLLQPLFKRTPHAMMRKLKMISGPFQAILFTVITLNPESNCTCREKNHFHSDEVHRRYQKHSYITWCNDGENIDDYCNVDGEKELSDAWTGFTRFMLLNERPPDGYTWSGWGLTRKQTTSRPNNVWPHMWKHLSDAANRKTNKSGLSRNQSSIMPDNYVVSSSLNQMMNNLNTPWKTLVESWKFRCQRQCHVKASKLPRV